jgi:hypothetical protein
MQGFWKDSWPIAFFGCPRGHRVNKETECLSTWNAYYRGGYSPSNPSAWRIDWPAAGMTLALAGQRLSSHAQADCRFNCSGSKCSPFFHIFKAIAAILRAKVSRAMAGFIPRASKF